MKHLPKHVRPRWRYLGVGLEAWPDADLSRRAFQRAVWYAAQNLLGDPGSADADLSVFRFRFRDGRGEAVVRARRGEVSAARAAVACVEAVDGYPVGVRVRGVSGTVRACEESYLGRTDADDAEERPVEFEGERRTATVRGDARDVHLPSGFAGATAIDVDAD